MRSLITNKIQGVTHIPACELQKCNSALFLFWSRDGFYYKCCQSCKVLSYMWISHNKFQSKLTSITGRKYSNFIYSWKVKNILYIVEYITQSRVFGTFQIWRRKLVQLSIEFRPEHSFMCHMNWVSVYWGGLPIPEGVGFVSCNCVPQ